MNTPPDFPILDLSLHLDDFRTPPQRSGVWTWSSQWTSVAHPAGALGRPVWVLLSFLPDWRWLLGREDSPWYPSMRLFRQKTPGDWKDVFQRIAAALEDVA